MGQDLCVTSANKEVAVDLDNIINHLNAENNLQEQTTTQEKNHNTIEEHKETGIVSRSLLKSTVVDIFPDLNDHIKNVIKKLDKKMLQNVEQPNNLSENPLEGPLKNEEKDSVYYGQTNNDMKHGWGKQIFDNELYYQGYFENDLPNGWGLQISSTGECFIGTWKQGDINGYAEYYNTSGGYYKGHWKNHKQDGYGEEEVYDYNTETKYKGNYLDGKKHGNGSFFWLSGNDMGNKYTGNFFQNHIHGQGIYTWKDGREYEGDWQYGKMNGKGVRFFF